jgi:hypothetical protein
MYQEGDAANRTALAAAWLAQHLFGGALLGEHLGQLLGIAWSVTLSVIVLRSRVLPRWLGLLGLIVSVLYLFNQGDILATALPGFLCSILPASLEAPAGDFGLPPSASRSCFGRGRRTPDTHITSRRSIGGLKRWSRFC